MVTLLGGIPLDRINAQAREVHFGRLLLTFIAAVLYVVGWAAFKIVRVTLLAVAWCVAAVAIGWQESRTGGTRGPA